MPENNNFAITDLEGCGPWVFSETEYYTFQARYWDGDGTADLDTMKINFTDGVTEVVAVYDYVEDEFTLESGSTIAMLREGSITVIDDHLLQVTFLIYFTNKVLDALDVDIYMWCNDTSGAEEEPAWEDVPKYGGYGNSPLPPAIHRPPWKSKEDLPSSLRHRIEKLHAAKDRIFTPLDGTVEDFSVTELSVPAAVAQLSDDCNVLCGIEVILNCSLIFSP